MKILLLGAALAMGQAVWAQPALRLRSCGGRPCPARPALAPEALLPRHHYILQFRTYPGPAARADLPRRGLRVLGYVPDSGLMVSTGRNPDLRGLDVAWAGALEAQDKLSPWLETAAPGAYVLVFFADVPMDTAAALAAAHGFQVLANPSLLPGQLLVAGGAAGIAPLAASDEVAYILPASPDLLAGNPVMACAGAVTEAGPVGEYVTVGKGWSKDASGTAAVAYVFESLTEKVDSATVESEIERAFREWQKYAAISISPGSAADAARTLAIQFASGAHGDGYPFDGPGGVLAHTFYPAPPNSEPIAGDMHLDADEAWRVGSYVDLFSVALHEAGHALGLGHSSQPGAVMYPYYRFSTGLTSDDIAGIQALYGVGQGTAAPPVTPVQPAQPTQPPAQPPAPPPSSPPSQPDTTPPSVTIGSPGGTIVSVSAASLHIAGTATDNVGVTSVKWSTSNGDAGVAAGTAAWSADIPLLLGNTVVTVRAYDAAGNSGWRAITVIRN